MIDTLKWEMARASLCPESPELPWVRIDFSIGNASAPKCHQFFARIG